MYLFLNIISVSVFTSVSISNSLDLSSVSCHHLSRHHPLNSPSNRQTHTHIHIYIHTHTYTHTHKKHIHTDTYTNIHTHISTQKHTHRDTHRSTQKHIYTHIYTYTHLHGNIHIQTHTHIQMLSFKFHGQLNLIVFPYNNGNSAIKFTNSVNVSIC
jgi:hypothetical protein